MAPALEVYALDVCTLDVYALDVYAPDVYAMHRCCSTGCGNGWAAARGRRRGGAARRRRRVGAWRGVPQQSAVRSVN